MTKGEKMSAAKVSNIQINKKERSHTRNSTGDIPPNIQNNKAVSKKVKIKTMVIRVEPFTNTLERIGQFFFMTKVSKNKRVPITIKVHIGALETKDTAPNKIKKNRNGAYIKYQDKKVVVNTIKRIRMIARINQAILGQSRVYCSFISLDCML